MRHMEISTTTASINENSGWDSFFLHGGTIARTEVHAYTREADSFPIMLLFNHQAGHGSNVLQRRPPAMSFPIPANCNDVFQV